MTQQACSSQSYISKKTVKAMFDVGSRTRTWLDNLADDNWEVVSFNSKTREVCFNVINNAGLFHMSVTLPDPTFLRNNA